MDFTHNFGSQPEPVQPHLVYQDTKNTSSHYRTELRVFHPLTEHQFDNKFRVGDKVKMRLLYNNNDKMYINLTIMNIISYETAKQVLGSYSPHDAFKGVPFTRVLILE